MAHFAELDEQNTVKRIVVISNDDLLDENGIEQESLGVQVCNAVCGTGTWVQTSYNGNFRKLYAGVGYQYVPEADLFYYPHPPFPSWVLNSNYDWEAPVAKPAPVEGFDFVWDEETFTWESVPIPTLKFTKADVPVIGE